MSSSYFQDYFEGYSPGNVTPAGMTFQGGSVILGSGTGFEDTQCWQTGFAWRQGADDVDNVSIFMALNRRSQRDQNAGVFLQLLNTTSTFTNGVTPATVFFQGRTENDGTLSFIAGNQQEFMLGNTGKPDTGADPFVMSQDDWFTLQANVQFSSVAIASSTNHNLNVSVEIAIDGITLISTNVTATNVIIEANVGSALAVFNVPWWNGSGYYFDSMTYEAITTINDNPMPDASRAARLSAGAIEVSETPQDSAARASQLVTELEELPFNSAARASQLVIELMLRKIITGSWRVYEA